MGLRLEERDAIILEYIQGRGKAVKLPEDRRPSIETLERFLAITPEQRRLFAIDLQNDCACSTEPYDLPGAFAYWSEGGIKLQTAIGLPRWELPILPGILTEDMLNALIDAAGMTPAKFEAYDMLEYGVIAVNLRGWGAFCHVPGSW